MESTIDIRGRDGKAGEGGGGGVADPIQIEQGPDIPLAWSGQQGFIIAALATHASENR